MKYLHTDVNALCVKTVTWRQNDLFHSLSLNKSVFLLQLLHLYDWQHYKAVQDGHAHHFDMLNGPDLFFKLSWHAMTMGSQCHGDSKLFNFPLFKSLKSKAAELIVPSFIWFSHVPLLNVGLVFQCGQWVKLVFFSNLVEFSVHQWLACAVQNRSIWVATPGNDILAGGYH